MSRVDLSTVDFSAPSLQALPRAFDAQLLAKAPMLALPVPALQLAPMPSYLATIASAAPSLVRTAPLYLRNRSLLL